MKHSVPVICLMICLTASLAWPGCQPARERNVNNVTIWEIDDPTGLHPLLAFDATATEIKPLLFQSLLNFDFETYELIPVLANSRPTVQLKGDTAMALTYKIRPDARWDDGTPITAADVAFSFKAAATPSVNAQYLKPYVKIVERLEWNENTPEKITIHIDKVYMRAEASTGYEVPILPRHFYDPEGVLDDYSFKELIDMAKPDDPGLRDFGENITAEDYSRQGEKLYGSGAYRLKEWKAGQHILLEKKEDWWGHGKAEGNMYFEANPDSIIYQVISDQTAALTALKGGQLDVMRSIKAKDFDEKMKHNEQVIGNFNLHNPPMLAYSALGLNMSSPVFESRKTRQAMAYLTHYDHMISDVMNGYGQRTTGPVFPIFENYYNDTLTPYAFDPDKAGQLLRADGWKDDNGDGLLEKERNGKTIDFEFDFILNKGQQEREAIALILQDELRHQGIKMNIESLDWGVVVLKMQSHDFDMMYISLGGDPAPEDFTQLWSTASRQGGYNFVNFGNARTDSLIGLINQTLDDNQRAHLVRQFQELIHHQVPYIYLWNPTNRMAIHNRFKNTNISAVRPGYWVPGFTLK